MFAGFAFSSRPFSALTLDADINSTPLTDVETRQLYDRMSELHLIHGLLAGSPLVVTATRRTAGAVTQALAEQSQVQTTVARQA